MKKTVDILSKYSVAYTQYRTQNSYSLYSSYCKSGYEGHVDTLWTVCSWTHGGTFVEQKNQLALLRFPSRVISTKLILATIKQGAEAALFFWPGVLFRFLGARTRHGVLEPS